MPIQYGVLKCKAIDRSLGTSENPHYQVHALANDVHYRIAINVKSKLSPSELLYYTIENFQHEITSGLPDLAFGYTRLESKPDGMALDFIRGNLFDRMEMVPLAFDIPGLDNDLNEKIDHYIRRAMEVEDAVIYAFGDVWGPEESKPDKIFGFLPGRGIHDIHMNQGNVGHFKKDDGVYQDGGLLIHFPSENKWIATFLAFQSQSWHTDDFTGHALENVPIVAPDNPHNNQIPTEGALFIVGALVKLAGPDSGKETVTLLNAANRKIDLIGYMLKNKAKQKYMLQGEIKPGEFLTIAIEENEEFFRNKGDIITLLDANGLKIHGVSYTKHQVRTGWTIKF